MPEGSWKGIGAWLSRVQADGRMLGVLLLFQLSAVLVAGFVPFGFDQPSALGLHFGPLLVLAGFYGVVLAMGLALGTILRRWWVVLGEQALPSLFLLLALSGALGT